MDELDAPAAKRVLGAYWKDKVVGSLKTLVTDLPDLAGKALAYLLRWQRTNPDKRKEVHTRLASLEEVLIEGLNKAFEAHRGNDATSAVVVLVDNLEKLTEKHAGDANAEALYLRRLAPVQRLEAHWLLTVPTHIAHSTNRAALENATGGRVLSLPQVPVTRRVMKGQEKDDQDGIAALVSLLTRRVDCTLFHNPDTGPALIAKESGGVFRDALRMIMSAMRLSNQQITNQTIEDVIRAEVADCERQGLEPYGMVLRHVEDHNRFPPNCTPTMRFELLRTLRVLEYVTHEGDLYYAVHPLVASTRAVREPQPTP